MSNHSAHQLREPVAPWVGRLIFDRQWRTEGVDSIRIELEHAPHAELVGTVATLRWADTVATREYVERTERNVSFTDVARASMEKGYIHPIRLDGLRRVGPLESLAGSRTENDIQVMLKDPVVQVESSGDNDGGVVLSVEREPVQVSGIYYIVVKFIGQCGEDDQFKVRHFNRDTKSFDGPGK